jgi:hypothetical protein
MSPRTLLLTFVTIALLGNTAGARDDRGFWVGGGVGSASCPDFLSAMATARKKGGLSSVVAFGRLVHTSTTSRDYKLDLTPKRMAFTISLNHSATMLLIAFCWKSSPGVPLILTKHLQSLCLLSRKAFEIN